MPKPVIPCTVCKHFFAEETNPPRCEAFPDGIPEDVQDALVLGETKHTDAIEGDHGVRFEKRTVW